MAAVVVVVVLLFRCYLPLFSRYFVVTHRYFVVTYRCFRVILSLFVVNPLKAIDTRTFIRRDTVGQTHARPCRYLPGVCTGVAEYCSCDTAVWQSIAAVILLCGRVLQL